MRRFDPQRWPGLVAPAVAPRRYLPALFALLGFAFAADVGAETADAHKAAAAADRLAVAESMISRGEYGGAADSLRVAIYSEDRYKKSARVWFLLGQCYAKMGSTSAAAQTYACVQKYFPGSTEAGQATQALKLLPRPVAAGSIVKPTAAPEAAKVSSQSGAAAVKSRLLDRVFVVPPRFGHAPVDARTVVQVKSVIAGLPERIYKILDGGKVNVYVVPNLIDRFPEAVSARHPVFGTYLSAEYGRTYERDVYICERLGAEGGGTELQPPLTAEAIKDTTYTMLSHALDSCLELPSRDEQFLRLYKQDLLAVDGSNCDLLKVYLTGDQSGAGETFAGLASSIMGDDTAVVRQLDHNFPRSRAWIQSRIQSLTAAGRK